MNERLLAKLDEAKRRRPGARETAALVRKARRARFADAESLVRLHDALLFLRAYPHSREVMSLCDLVLSEFAARVARLTESGADLSTFDGTTDRTIQVRVEIGNDHAAANLPFRRVGRNLRYP